MNTLLVPHCQAIETLLQVLIPFVFPSLQDNSWLSTIKEEKLSNRISISISFPDIIGSLTHYIGVDVIVLDIGDGVYVKKKKKNYLQDIQYQSSEDARNNSERQIVQNVNQKEERKRSFLTNKKRVSLNSLRYNKTKLLIQTSCSQD